MAKPKIYILNPSPTPKSYVSGHNIRRFFHVSEADLIEVRRKHKDKIIDKGFYKWYDISFLRVMFPIKADVPSHLVVTM